MTTTPDPTDTTTNPDTGQPPGADAPTAPGGGEPEDKGTDGSEAAKYRRRLRDTEGERDTLTATVERLQRKLIEDEAGRVHKMVKPAALWAAGTTVADVTTDTGDIDPDKLAAAAAAATESLGLSVKPRTPRADPSQGGGRNTDNRASRGGWAEALRRN